MRILVYSNPLVVDKVAKTFQFWKDSGFIYTKQLIKNLPSSWRFYWCIPDKIKGDDLGWFIEANKNIELIPYPYSTSIHQNRYNFSVNTLSKYFSYAYDIDAVLNNQPEVTSNLKVWFANQRRETPPIISFYHWIDCPESTEFGKDLSGYGIRQFDGAVDSYNVMFHNEYAYSLFEKQALSLVLPEHVSAIKDKVRYFHPACTRFTPVEFDTGVPDDKKIILFNHRLNNTTRWQEVVAICDEIYKTRQDFVLWMTDDGKLKELEDLKTRPYIIVKSLKDGEYGYILRKAHFSICNHKGYSTWNMAVLDSLANECLAAIPNREVYKSMFKKSIEILGGKCFHDGNLKELVIQLLNNSKETNSDMAFEIIKTEFDLFMPASFQVVRTAIEQVVMSSRTVKLPAKFTEVRNYIFTRKECLKKDWVNEFWSFHVNSNFTPIRRLLLHEMGIYDDTTQSETCYKVRKE